MRDELFSAAKGLGARCNGMPIRVSEEEKLENIIVTAGFPVADMEKRADVVRRLNAVSMEIGSLRIYNCAALLLCYVAAGRTNATFEQAIHLWDMAAGVRIGLEAGGAVSRMDGSPFTLTSRENLAGNPQICRKLLERMRESR